MIEVFMRMPMLPRDVRVGVIALGIMGGPFYTRVYTGE